VSKRNWLKQHKQIARQKSKFSKNYFSKTQERIHDIKNLQYALRIYNCPQIPRFKSEKLTTTKYRGQPICRLSKSSITFDTKYTYLQTDANTKIKTRSMQEYIFQP